MARAVRPSAIVVKQRRGVVQHVPPRIALEFEEPKGGFSGSARSPHHTSSCFIRLGSGRPSASMCL